MDLSTADAVANTNGDSTSQRRLTIALVGNPNTGKTTLFNALSGLNQRVGNYPGVTVETKKGQLTVTGRTFDLVDLPGTYSLAPRSPDEMVAVNLVLGRQQGESRPDLILSIVDASNLERNLYLTTQVMDLGIPVVVALNMIDVAQSHGVRIDSEKLSRQLGVPIVAIQANKKKGLDELRQTLAHYAVVGKAPRGPVFPEPFEKATAGLQELLGTETPCFLVRRLLLDVGGHTEKLLQTEHGPALKEHVEQTRRTLADSGCPVPNVEARTRYAWLRQAMQGCVERPQQRPVTWTDRLDRVLTHKVWGTLLFLFILFVVFQSIFTGGKWLMKQMSVGKDGIVEAVEKSSLPEGPVKSLLVEGIIEGVGGVVMFLPQIVILFGFISILEDCGYMARAAYLMDKLMSRCGLSGKSFIPLLSSVACAVPGIMATRVIENRRDRLATILVAPLMSCSARLPLYTLLIAAFIRDPFPWWAPGFTLFCLYLLGFVTAPLVAFALKRTLLRGETPVFVMEMPLYKMPSFRTVLRRMFDSAWSFVRRAGTLILASMVVVWALLYFPHTKDGTTYEELIADAGEDEQEVAALQQEWKENSILGRTGKFLEPVFRPLGWDWRIGTAALASFPAREVVVGTIGIIWKVGDVDTEEIVQADDAGETALGQELKKDENFSVPTALSLMVFFALCCQCASTLAVIKRETNSLRWPVFTFVYMTVLAYVGALVTYQVARLFWA